MGDFEASDYEFVICAYNENIYLEECINSLKNQSIDVNIILITSTPNAYIQKLVDKYGLEYHVNIEKSGITEDWNFGLLKSKGKVVTIAHQDDIYEPDFAWEVLANVNKQKKPLIAFTDYGELRNGEKVTSNKLLNIKRIMLFPLRSRLLQNIRFVRRRILSLGSPICCPSVTFIKENLPKVVFSSGFQSDADWQAWEKISKMEGAFVYCRRILMYHRIHKDSATTATIAEGNRAREDFEMFCKFWPKPVAGVLEYFYSKGEKCNSLD